jgi:hypothetical protein
LQGQARQGSSHIRREAVIDAEAYASAAGEQLGRPVWDQKSAGSNASPQHRLGPARCIA